ncbi:hypothetical protein Bhyg_02713 [Pseudolycoriella hygida]|uniref:Uncharacterized protein n=2 Tax=Pseudolycoriella hygida TaxID=35572 RepID=A0A9Q0RVR6_9DIPT|nr:hypothetical protein Bhyg_17858 [Pseudolycoriella hygida]KAJ6647490.1 hypothetical protein Bhyg_02713 [Pseudolycoriella hygida]
MSVYGSKVWKKKPPGPEQLLLDEMFENGSITAAATAESVRQSTEVFKQFSAKVFAVHFRKTRARLGEYVSDFAAPIPNIPGGVIPPGDVKLNAAGWLPQIPELGSNNTPTSTKRAHTEKSAPVAEMVNPPYRTWKYTDHSMQTEFVCVAINIFTGCKSVTFDVSEDGLKLIVTFSWAVAMHTSKLMFFDAIRKNILTTDHPMLHAMTSSLLEAGITENSTPEGKWIIPLPCKFRREVSSYKIEKLSYETTNMIFIKLTAYQNELIIHLANRTITFD